MSERIEQAEIITEDNIQQQEAIITNNTYEYIKSCMDFIGAIFGLIFLSPVILITIIAITLESKGPIIFKQDRVGKDGIIFKMYKFRSMFVDAERELYRLKDKNEMSGPMFKIKDDPRVTRIGRIIRRTSIDEVPQFINVLKGEMSLVGPRPSLPLEVNQFEEWMLERLSVKPGLTCFWQVSGRNDIDFENWMELDVMYIRERSLWLDIKLIFKTITVLFGDKHAR